MSIAIKEVKNKADLKAFIHLYTRMYKDCKYSASPLHFDEVGTLRTDKNPAHKHCTSQYWIAYKDGKPAGRIAAFINRLECEKENKMIGRFGWYDFIDDKAVSKALMDEAIKWMKEKSVVQLHGPLGFSDLDRQGLLIEGFEEMSTFATNYNYPYYQAHLEKMGFEKSTDWVEFSLNVEHVDYPRFKKIANFVSQKKGYEIIHCKNKKELRTYVPAIFRLLNKEYEGLYGFVSLTEEQIEYYADMFIGLIKMDLICLVKDKEGKLVGFGLTMPSFSKACLKAQGSLFPTGWFHFLQAMRKNDTIDFYLIAIDKEHQNNGVNALFMAHIAEAAMKMKVKWAETNINLEDNDKIQSMWSRSFDHRQHKRRRCYSINL
ncbi:hypothetical protein EMN47_19615 [Prolixibacteraceae bacterium JC049]|nr:hypothetical protein [Prolixibacteraceae bacterium JC049]